MSDHDGSLRILEHGLAPRLVTPDDVPPRPPAVMLCNPKYPHNVAATLRACAIFDVGQLWFTGDRVIETIMGMSSKKGKARIPREERMRDYKTVKMFNHDRPLELFGKNCTPIAVEFRENSERLPDFQHPDDAVYLFGPEDGSVPGVLLQHCHRFLIIPSKIRTPLNLGAAVNVILAHRYSQLESRQRMAAE